MTDARKNTIVYGKHPVEEILTVAREHILRIVVDRPDRVDVEATTGLVVLHDPQLLEKLCGRGNHQGIAAELRPFRYATLDQILDGEDGCILVLDQVQDPHNLGAMLRTAAALGVRAVVIGKDRAAAVTDTVIRTSAGLAFRVDVVQVTNIARTLEQLAEHGFWSVALVSGDVSRSEEAGAPPLWEVDLAAKTTLVMGGEGPGLRRLVLQRCDLRATIPMANGAQSLNVSVAAGMAIYEWSRQRTRRQSGA